MIQLLPLGNGGPGLASSQGKATTVHINHHTPVNAIAICRLNKELFIPTEIPIQIAITITDPTFAAPAHQAERSFVTCSSILR